MKILIIEDDKLLAEALQTLLEIKGFDVEVVYDGEDGTEYAETGIYDLLIMDAQTQWVSDGKAGASSPCHNAYPDADRQK